MNDWMNEWMNEQVMEQTKWTELDWTVSILRKNPLPGWIGLRSQILARLFKKQKKILVFTFPMLSVLTTTLYSTWAIVEQVDQHQWKARMVAPCGSGPTLGNSFLKEHYKLYQRWLYLRKLLTLAPISKKRCQITAMSTSLSVSLA